MSTSLFCWINFELRDRMTPVAVIIVVIYTHFSFFQKRASILFHLYWLRIEKIKAHEIGCHNSMVNITVQSEIHYDKIISSYQFLMQHD